MLIEHPVRNDFKLVDTDKPAETASDFYRFQVKVARRQDRDADRHRGTRHRQQRPAHQQQRRPRSASSSTSTVTSQKVKDGLKQALKLRRALAKTQREIAELERQLKVITDDQARLRANLQGDAADGGGVQALPEEVRRAGDADREVPGRHQEAPGRRAPAAEGVRGLPRQLLRRVTLVCIAAGGLAI